MAKPKSEFGQKDKIVCFRISQEMYDMISYEAGKCGISFSDYCRRALLNQPIKKLPVIIHDEREIAQALRNINTNISKLGNNMNQIARHLNQGGAITEPVWGEIKNELTKLDLSIHDFNLAVEKEYGSN